MDIPTKPKIVLIVEDDKALRRVLDFRLSQENYHVLAAEDGEAGLRFAKEELPNVILLDLIMPKMNGFETLRRLKADETTKDIPVIVLSNLNQQGDLEEAKRLGAAHFFLKIELSMDKVVEEIKKIIG